MVRPSRHWVFAATFLTAVFLAAPSAEAQTCYRGCDARYSSCYADCGGADECRRRCLSSRFSCVDGCVPAPTALEERVLRLVNAERAEAGLAPLQWNPRLARAARLHATAMARQERMDHAMDGEGPGERVRRQGYAAYHWGENLAKGWGSGGTPEMIVEWWMGSPPHRANVLSPGFTETGLGVRLGHDGKSYYCETFGGP